MTDTQWKAFIAQKELAHRAVRNAVANGTLVRGSCEGRGPHECKGAVHGHHDDYWKPLEVRWLCLRHHWWHHRQLYNGIWIRRDFPYLPPEARPGFVPPRRTDGIRRRPKGSQHQRPVEDDV